MKEITLKIKGTQCYEDREEDQMEFVTDGRIYVRGKYAYIIYEESELSGFTGCKTTLRLGQDSVKMKRVGQDGPGTEMYFEKGERFSSFYNTPYGSMGLEILTKNVQSDFDLENLKGTVNIEYDVCLEGLGEGRNKLSFDVM